MKNDYSDIINTQWPKVSDRKKMALKDRAKIFLPFAALKGHNEAIQEQEKLSVEEAEKSYYSELDIAFQE